MVSSFRAVIVIYLGLALCAQARAANNQLYTGDATTVPPDHAQLQFYYDSSFGGPQRVSGGSLFFGIAKRADVKVGYGNLWNDVGPDVRIGPNIGVKWRVIGDARTKPSVAFSGLYAINGNVGGRSRKNDVAGLMIIQYPVRPYLFLLNFGRVWVGDNAPDLRYIAFAPTRLVSPRTLVALEYSDLRRMTSSPQARTNVQIAAGMVYNADAGLSYSAQLGYLPYGRNIHWHMTLGVSKYF